MSISNTAGSRAGAAAGILQRSAILLYGLLAYAAFFIVIVYLIGFVTDLFVPVSVNRGPESNVVLAIIVNLGLIATFAVQHTIMARPGFKQWFTRYIPESAERSTFVLLASLILAALCFFWQPIPGIVWQVESTLAAAVLWTICGAGWLLLFASSYMIDHYDLFGLRHVWLQFQQREYTFPEFVTRGAYKYVRHPLMLGVLMGVWAIPTMTWGHLLLACGFTAYILVGTWFEERDLVRMLGEKYREYQRAVPKLIPWLGRTEKQ
jgi:protein-S-isoprenylcysteine O-methyltransferase Ste14